VWTFLKMLGTMGAGETRRMDIYQSGFPPGYHLENYEVHVYDRAVELATNLSRKRVELTDEEALEFRIIEYIGANKGRTLRATPLISTIPDTVLATLTPEQQRTACYLRVGTDGRVTGAFRDAAGKKPLGDPTLEAALATLVFNPALEAGKPVESIVAIKPASS